MSRRLDVTPPPALRGSLAITFPPAASGIAVVCFPTYRDEALMRRFAETEVAPASPFACLLGGLRRGEFGNGVPILALVKKAEHQVDTLRAGSGRGVTARKPKARTDAAHQVDALSKAMRIKGVGVQFAAEERSIHFGDQEMDSRGSVREFCPWHFWQRNLQKMSAPDRAKRSEVRRNQRPAPSDR